MLSLSRSRPQQNHGMFRAPVLHSCMAARPDNYQAQSFKAESGADSDRLL
jgi:hypothetical protein